MKVFNKKEWLQTTASVVGSAAFLALIYGCGCGGKSGKGGFPPPEPPNAEVETATAGQIAASIPPTAEPIPALAGGDDPNVKKEDQKATPGGREVAGAATAKDKVKENKKSAVSGGNGNDGARGFGSLPKITAGGGGGSSSEVKNDSAKPEGGTASADKPSDGSGLAATEGQIISESQGYEGVGAGAAGGEKKANPFGGFGGGGEAGSNFGGPESANFGAGGPDAPSNGVINGGQGDLDAYLARVGRNSLFEVINKRYDKWGNEIEADKVRAEFRRTANQ